MNYNLALGGELLVPFQLYYGDVTSNTPHEANEESLLDPTQGFAIQFPVAWYHHGRRQGGLCNFGDLEGSCLVGGDVTVRSVQLNKTVDGEVEESAAFGASVSLKASFLFPILDTLPGTNEVGHLSLAVGFRYYHHNADSSDVIFGELADPEGEPIDFDGDFAAFSFESEFEINKNFKVRLEYFKPTTQRDLLDDVVKISFVAAPADRQ